MAITTQQGIGYGSLALSVGSALSSVVGAYYSSAAAKDALNAQSEIAKINSRISELGAESAVAAGQQQSSNIATRAGQIKSSQIANLAANGVDLTSASARELLASTDIQKTMDMNTVESNAAMQAWGYRMQGTNQMGQAAAASATAGGVSPWGSASASLLSGAGQVASSWYAMSKAK